MAHASAAPPSRAGLQLLGGSSRGSHAKHRAESAITDEVALKISVLQSSSVIDVQARSIEVLAVHTNPVPSSGMVKQVEVNENLQKLEIFEEHGVARVKLADGTILTAANLVALSHQFTGTTGSDTLTGTSGADLTDGKGGSDSVVGGGGNDTFVFNAGYGHLQVNEKYASGQLPILKLGAGITAAALHVTQSGSNLVLTDGTTGDQAPRANVTFNSMWSSSNSGVASVTLAAGTPLTQSQLIAMGTPAATKSLTRSSAMSTTAIPIPVNALIQAMASYAENEPSASTTTLTVGPNASDLLLHAAA